MRKRITIERTFDAPIEDVWDLWTTKDGIESWWGPEGFTVTVQEIDLRPGGLLLYTMTATAPAQVEWMKKSNMPIAQPARITYKEIVSRTRLVYTNHVDFVPGVTAYDVGTMVELEKAPGGVRMILTLEPMHDDEWTNRAAMGWESELGKLAKVLEKRK
jgi:uncharacterized protein YndB with AHSA1/START domain